MVNVTQIDKDFVDKFRQDQEIEDFLRLFGQKDEKYRNQVRVKAVKSPSAQIAELCEKWKTKEPQINVKSLLDNPKSGLSSVDKAVLELQFLYGLRISEVLNIKPTDIGSNGNIQIKGLKGSENRVVYAVRFRNFWEQMRVNNFQLPNSYNRFYFYRLYKKKGIYQAFGKNRKSSTTHYLRYLYIQELLTQGIELEQIKLIIGHKSIKSTIHYVSNIIGVRKA